MRDNVVKEKSYRFALRTIRLYKWLNDHKKEFVISRQILKSGTAIGALIEEANQAESKADFIHKLSIANKEAHETHYWLRLLRDSESLDKDHLSLLHECEELLRLLTAIIKSSKSNLKK